MEDVKKRGDEAVRDYSLKFDGVELDDFLVSGDESQKLNLKSPKMLKQLLRKPFLILKSSKKNLEILKVKLLKQLKA